MFPTANGSLRIFRLFGISVYVHWSWLLVALYEVQWSGRYHNMTWAWIEYLTLFAIVLTHEFGHALACHSVGGKAERIVLWPLGGVAYVNPPFRPGAFLWSIAAGPLVNVILVPITLALALFVHGNQGLVSAEMRRFLENIAVINGILLVFNLFPIYPLDGGQILQALLWFFVGFARSLQIVAVIGLIAAAIALPLCLLWTQDYWFAIMAVFVGMRAWNGFRLAKAMAQAERQARADAEQRLYGAPAEPWAAPGDSSAPGQAQRPFLAGNSWNAPDRSLTDPQDRDRPPQ